MINFHCLLNAIPLEPHETTLERKCLPLALRLGLQNGRGGRGKEARLRSQNTQGPQGLSPSPPVTCLVHLLSQGQNRCESGTHSNPKSTHSGGKRPRSALNLCPMVCVTSRAFCLWAGVFWCPGVGGEIPN